MSETLRNVLAASVLAISPVAVEAETAKLPPAYMRSNDDREEGIVAIPLQPEVRRREQKAPNIGAFVRRAAARNHQMGHRYRGDTR